MSSQSLAVAYADHRTATQATPVFRVIEGGRRGHEAARSRSVHGAAHLGAREALLGLFGVALVLVTLASAWRISDALVSARAHDAPAGCSSAAVTVLPGDSLWLIAERHPVSGCTTAELVRHIKEANHLSTSALSAGMVLDVPIAG